VFLVDGSSSIGIDNFQEVRQFLRKFIEGLDIGADKVRVGLAQYSNEPHQEFLLKDHMDKQSLLAQVDNLPYRMGGTETGKAISFLETQYFTAQAGSRINQRVPQIAIVITDGESEDDVIAPTQQLRKQGVIIFGSASLNETKVIATAPYIYQSTNIVPALKSAFEIEQELIPTGGERVFFIISCELATLADIVFIVDESGSITTPNFQLIRSFLCKIVDGLEISQQRVRVGIVTYNDRPTAQVYLNTFKDKSETLQFIKILPYRGGGTNTGAALKFARERVFIKERGSRKRQGVQQVAVVITDGKSQDAVSQEAADLRRAGVTVYAVGIKDANKTELEQMASYPSKKHVFTVGRFAKLKTLQQSLQKILCYNIIRQAITINTRRTGIKEGLCSVCCIQTDEADIFFLIDHSTSIQPKDFSDMKKFITEFLDTFHIGKQHIRVGVAKYASSPNLEFNLTTYSDAKSLKKAVENISHEGGVTNTGAALSFMGPIFERAMRSRGHKVPEYLVVITDGKSSDKVKVPAEKLRAQGVIIYAIGVKDANEAELVQIAGTPEKKFFVNDFDGLKPIKDDIVTDICSQDACKDIPSDLLFLIDSSGSINPGDYQKMKDFMNSVVTKSNVGQNDVHIGIMQFSTEQMLQFPLNHYYDKDNMWKAIDAMRQMGGGTHTGAAITAVSQYFSATQGGREDLRQRLIVITDGEATDEVKRPAEALRAKGVVIYAIGVVNANTTQLLEISGSQDRVYSERDFDALKDLESEVAMEICDSGRDCKKTEVADIIFLVDGSTSITHDKFRSMLKFMESMVNQTIVGEKLTRFGIILFSNDPKSMFTLEKCSSKREILKAIAALKSPDGDTYTGKALEYSLQFFGAQHGGRAAQKVPQILMVITDGDATDRYNLREPSKALRDNGVSVISIGVEGAKRDQLEIMAGGDTSRVFYVDNFKVLETLYQNITHVLCNTAKPACEKQKADLVMLLDQSGSITSGNYTIMKTFATELVTSFKVSEEFVRVGVAQFSSSPQKEFYLNEYYTEEEVNKHILNMRQLRGGTNIGQALKFIRDYFQASRGSRIAEGISQNLILITDGASQDDVEDAANDLRAFGIEVFAIGIGDVQDLELLQITGNPEKLFTVQNFDSLVNINVDIAMGFDISQRSGAPGQLLVSGQLKLERFLPEIVDYVSSMQGLCCTGTTPIKPNIAFRVVSRDGQFLYDFNFEEYNENVLKKVMNLQMSEATYFNTALLQSFRNKFRVESRAGVKVLVIFSDGLDEDVMKLEEQSELLRKSGVHALLTVALEGVHDASQLQMVEFGRGFGYKLPLSIGMQSVGSTILKQIVSTSCSLLPSGGATCIFSGDCSVQQTFGEVKGAPGPSGPQGIQGCPGTRGQKVRVVFSFSLSLNNNSSTVWFGSSYSPPSAADRMACPAYPTELLFGLDMSEDVTPAAFERMRSALLSLLEDIAIAESNCPTGARVAVVGYSAHTKYLIRFQDFHRKKQLIDAIKNVALEPTASRRHLGAAMRYVGHNVFKRVRQGVRMRKVAVFFSSGPSQDSSDIVTAVMEYRASNIVPVVISLQSSPAIRQALEVGVVSPSQNLAAGLRRVQHCAICYDPCRPLQECAGVQEVPRPQAVDVDLAMVVDGSREIQADQYAGVQQLLGSVVEQLAVSPQPRRADGQARVAIVQQSGQLYGGASTAGPAAKLEFDLQGYQDQGLMKRHLVQSMQQQGGPSALGHTLEFALREVLLKANKPRRNKLLLVVVGAETAHWDRAKLHYISQKAKCQGVALFVVAVGEHYNRTEVEELASLPVQQHLIHVGHLKPEEQGYAQRFLRVFLNVLNRRMNEYPPVSLRRTCEQLERRQGQEALMFR
uniref:Collagen type VI alpha 6 chain n=1 Tax=Myripristis murdjan TaxID=586833 RepID=A0A667YNI2_9TELE